jgi:hypothetical protein
MDGYRYKVIWSKPEPAANDVDQYAGLVTYVLETRKLQRAMRTGSSAVVWHHPAVAAASDTNL